MNEPNSTVFGAFVGGRVVHGHGPQTEMRDPATGRLWGHATDSLDLVDAALDSATQAARDPRWRDLDATQRGRLLLRLADLIEANAEQLAPLEVRAAGKLLKTTQREMARAAAWYRFFGGLADKMPGQSIRLSVSAEAKTVREPIGVVAAITPFNGPFSLGAWKMAPALAAGNVIVVKPPLECPGTTLLLGELAIEAGFPAGVINVVPGGAEVGQALVSDRRVDMVSFTGSSPTARRIGAEAGALMKRFVCEAGGKSAHIVFDDADLDSALIAARQGVFSNAGQTCVAGARLLVHRSHYENVLERLIEGAARLRLGNPLDPKTHIGPLASKRQFDRVSAMVSRAKSEGAQVFGGGKPDLPSPFDEGYFFKPTIIVGAGTGTEIWREEVFGPAVAVVPFDDEDEAVVMANDSEYGLAAGMWTRSMARADRVSRRLRAGTVWVNTYRMMDYRVPFGGYGQSGLGRENGIDAVREFQMIKAVVTDHAPPLDPFAD
ncbi:aldehyde dehydrogenase family protein [Corticibacterium sp. UT-5YL-CI-8]|nr:aldehyde dehydrogenase family protein [Tianweitania sp. UT-5YL-CI-8]